MTQALTPALHTKLLTKYIEAKLLRYNTATIQTNLLHRDGRTAPKIARELSEAGYLLIVEGSEWLITDKIYNEFDAVEVNLCEVWDAHPEIYRDHQLAYVRFEDLSMGEKKWVLEHDEFEFHVRGNNDKKINELTFEICSDNKVGSAIFNPYRETMLVSTPELIAHAKKAIAEKDFNEVANNNLNWGVEVLGLLTEKEAEALPSPTSSLGINVTASFRKDRSKWAEDLQNNIANLNKRIGSLQGQLDACLKLQRNVEAAGGWGKVMPQYEERLREALSKEKEKNG